MNRKVSILILLILASMVAACSTHQSPKGNWKSVEVWDGAQWMRPTRENDYVLMGFSSGTLVSKVPQHPKDNVSYSLSADRTPPEILVFGKNNIETEVWQYKIDGDRMTIFIYRNPKGIVANPDFDNPPKVVSKAIRFDRFNGEIE